MQETFCSSVLITILAFPIQHQNALFCRYLPSLKIMPFCHLYQASLSGCMVKETAGVFPENCLSSSYLSDYVILAEISGACSDDID